VPRQRTSWGKQERPGIDNTLAIFSRRRRDAPCDPKHVLIISDDSDLRLIAELSIPLDIPVRSVTTSADAEETDSDIVVVAGSSPLAEVEEVREHPALRNKPVVVFAPGSSIEASADPDVWMITAVDDAVRELGNRVRLLAYPQRGRPRDPAA
jgi:hypothetical protein